ncbi:transcriptional regulator [Corynebacterium suranareeae]|uniref:Transcriptional regulator n=1 Tax=Corynebacterium suranareeae TaxID=2506452 RepID=A0A160PSP2_9CORY|nr:PadR family transcriptional regulator [Corynebacterium suranareeae]BAU96715.1 transcriptional regulator [Corynebacterium suranareeae]
MTLRSALLALLSSGPLTGYEASQRFGASVGFVWSGSDSQIYPELRKMESEELLVGSEVPWGSKGATKTEYALSEKGWEALRKAWQDPIVYGPTRDPARLKAAYFEVGSQDDARRHLRAHIAHFEQVKIQSESMIEELKAKTHPTLARRLARSPQSEHERIVAFKVFAYEGQIIRARAEIEWAEKGLALLGEI